MIESFSPLVANLQAAACGPTVTSGDLELGTAIEVERGQVRMKRCQRVRHRAPDFLFLGIKNEARP